MGSSDMLIFDIAPDAFANFKNLLTRHKLFSAEFLEQHYERFFSEYEKLLHSENYVTKRQSLKVWHILFFMSFISLHFVFVT